MGQGSMCRGLGLSSDVSQLLPPVPRPISTPGPTHRGCLWCLAGPWSQAQDRGREVILKWQFKNVWGLPLCQGCREWVCPAVEWGPWVSMSLYPEGIPVPRSASSLVLWRGWRGWQGDVGAREGSSSCLPLLAAWAPWGKSHEIQIPYFL